MIELILSSLYFILPAYVANMCPVIFQFLPGGIPINERLFGSHKTWRGIIVAYFGALLVLSLQAYFAENTFVKDISLLDYDRINIFLYALPFGIGAILGDLIKSYNKRRLGIKPGAPFFPFDQIDFVISAYLTLMPLYLLPWPNLLVILVVTPILHFFTNVLAYFLGMKKVWW